MVLSIWRVTTGLYWYQSQMCSGGIHNEVVKQMSNRIHVPPIENDTLTYVGIRVAVRLVALDYKRNPVPYRSHPPTAVLHLAGRLRMAFPALWPPLVFVAKALAQGSRLAEVRSMDVEHAVRALHKRRPT
jgi:hypothetical protein